MPDLQLRPALSYSMDTLNQIFVQSFEGYFVPIPDNVQMFAYRVRSEHVDLNESLVAEIDGKPAGLSLSARRVGKTRLAGLGVCKAFRGQGVGQHLTRAFMQPALERKDLLVLECFQVNVAALQLYLKQGFQVHQSLLGYSGTVVPENHPDLQELPLTEAVQFVREHADPELPWQIAPDTLISLPPTARAYRLQNSVAIVSAAGEQLYLRSLVTRPEFRRQGQATRLLKAISASTGNTQFQAVPIFPERLIRPLAEKLGWQQSDLCQYELLLQP